MGGVGSRRRREVKETGGAPCTRSRCMQACFCSHVPRTLGAPRDQHIVGGLQGHRLLRLLDLCAGCSLDPETRASPCSPVQRIRIPLKPMKLCSDLYPNRSWNVPPASRAQARLWHTPLACILLLIHCNDRDRIGRAV